MRDRSHYSVGSTPLASWNAAQDYQYYDSDGLGSTRELTDQYGSVTSVYDYDPFGTPTAIGSAGTIATTDMTGYTGMRQDSATRLVQLGARLYEPQTGRFTQPDPLGYADGANLYAYAGKAPTWRTDRSELFPDDETESEALTTLPSTRVSSRRMCYKLPQQTRRDTGALLPVRSALHAGRRHNDS